MIRIQGSQWCWDEESCNARERGATWGLMTSNHTQEWISSTQPEVEGIFGFMLKGIGAINVVCTCACCQQLLTSVKFMCRECLVEMLDSSCMRSRLEHLHYGILLYWSMHFANTLAAFPNLMVRCRLRISCPSAAPET